MRNSTVLPFSKYYHDDQIKDEMDVAFRKHGKMRNTYKIFGWKA
jgi:hypothetical protein